MAAATHFDTVQKIYIAFYQRPADPAGLKYWAERIDQAGGDAQAVVSAFATSPEAVALYGTIDDTTIGSVIDKIYDALFNTTPDDAGKKFYVDGFKAGTFTAGTIALNVLNGATGDDAVAIANKLQVSNEFTQQIDGRPLNDPYFGAGTKFNVTYAGDADAQAARDLLKTVTFSPASVLDPAEVTAQIIAKIADPTDPIVNKGSAFTLTTGADMATANQFDAPTVVTQVGAQIDTLQSTDKLTGTGDNPTLNAILSTNVIATPTLSGIETINVQAQVGARTLNLSKAVGVKALNVDSSQQSLTVQGVTSLVNVSVANGADVGPTEMDTLIQFADSVVTGAADTAKVTLTNNGSALVASDQFINLRGTSAGGFETLEITATGANRIAEILSDVGVGLDVGAGATNSVRTIKVDGEGSLRVQNALTSTTTFDASANKGGVNVTLDNAGDITVTGGEGNDTFNLGANLTNTDKVDGGAGRDTVSVSAGTGLGVGNKVSNVEILRVNGAATSFTFDNDDITTIDAIVHNVAGGVGMTYQDMAVAAAADATKGLTILDAGNLVYNLKGVGGLGSSDQGLYTTIGSSSAASALQTAGGVATGTLGTDASSLTLDVKAFGGQTALGTGIITADRATSITIKGGAATEAFTIAGIAATNLVLNSIDASTFAGNLTVAGTGGAQAIKGGSGNDVLGTGGRAAFTGAELGDILSGGAGNDTFTFAVTDSTSDTAGVTDVNGGVSGAFTAAQKALFTQITDLNLGGATAATQVDLLDLTAVNGAFTGATTVVVNAGAATALAGVNFGTAVNAVLADLAGLGALAASLPVGTTAVAGLFTWGGETFLIATHDIGDATAGYTAGEDIIINITGVTGTLDAADFV